MFGRAALVAAVSLPGRDKRDPPVRHVRRGLGRDKRDPPMCRVRRGPGRDKRDPPMCRVRRGPGRDKRDPPMCRVRRGPGRDKRDPPMCRVRRVPVATSATLPCAFCREAVVSSASGGPRLSRPRPFMFSHAIQEHSSALDTATRPHGRPTPFGRGCCARIPISAHSFRPCAVACPSNRAETKEAGARGARSGGPHPRRSRSRQARPSRVPCPPGSRSRQARPSHVPLPRAIRSGTNVKLAPSTASSTDGNPAADMSRAHRRNECGQA